MFCKSCGKKVLESDNYCSKCGEITKEDNKDDLNVQLRELSFDELENKFLDNHYKLKKLKKSDPKYDEILNINEKILDHVHIINQH
jgi:predicted amidophosphoribosyltransferase